MVGDGRDSVTDADFEGLSARLRDASVRDAERVGVGRIVSEPVGESVMVGEAVGVGGGVMVSVFDFEPLVVADGVGRNDTVGDGVAVGGGVIVGVLDGDEVGHDDVAVGAIDRVNDALRVALTERVSVGGKV